MLAMVVALADFEGQPTLEFLQGQTGALFGLARLAAARRVAGGAGQTLQPLHQRAVHALDVAAIVRAADRPVVELDAVLSAAQAKGTAAELGRVVQVQPLRQAGHRPVDLQPQVSQPGRLGLDDAADQEGHGASTGPLHADDPELAAILFEVLASSVAAPATVYLDVPEINAGAMLLVEGFHMTREFETARMYTGSQPEIPMDRVFGGTSFEIG